MDNLGTLVVATGALGTAAFGIVDALKWTRVGVFGFAGLTRSLGPGVMKALGNAYGPDVEAHLKELYRAGRASGKLKAAIRQGVRVGLTEESACELAKQTGDFVDQGALREAGRKLKTGEDLTDAEQGVVGRFELSLDARVDAALALANSRYVGYVRLLSAAAALGIAVLGWCALRWAGDQGEAIPIHFAVFVGLAAVPVAPVAKELVAGITQAKNALRART